MADLTVLSSLAPIPPHPSFSRSTYSLYSARASSSRISLSPQKSRPKLTQLDTAKNSDEKPGSDSENSASPSSGASESPKYTESPTASPRLAIVSPMPIKGNRPTHRPTRSQSAPPERTTFRAEDDTPTPRSHTHPGTLYATPATATGQFSPSLKTRLRKGSSTFNSPSSIWGYGGSYDSEPTDLPKPPPPLHRPTTFWRRTPRSGVTSSLYSPSSYIIRRSTFVAAGLPFDKPMYDASALSVESRVIHDAISGKVTEAFWEVIEAR